MLRGDVISFTVDQCSQTVSAAIQIRTIALYRGARDQK